MRSLLRLLSTLTAGPAAAPVDTSAALDAATTAQATADAAALAVAGVRGSLPANVKDYGAIGDGITDDTTALQTAIATGRNVHLPAGAYTTTAPLTLTAKQTISGAGMSLTYINNTGAEAAVIFEGNEHRTLRDIGILGAAASSSHGIEFRSESTAYVTLERVRVYRVGGHGIHGGHAGNVNNVTISGCEIQGCALDGINMQYLAGGTNEVNAIWVKHCNISANTGNGITFSGNAIHITENTIQVNRQHGIAHGTATPVPDTVPRPTYGSTIAGNYFEGNCYSATANASPIGLYVGLRGGSGFNRIIRNLEISNNFFNEAGAKYRSLIHVNDVAGTTDTASRAVVVRTRNNNGKIRILTWEGAYPLSQGFSIEEDSDLLMPAAMLDALPIWVQVAGNSGQIAAPAPYRKIITRVAGYTLNGPLEAGCLNRMTNPAPVNVNLHTYPLQSGYAVAYVVTGAGSVSFPATGGNTIYGNPGPYPTGSLVTATRLSPTEWVLS